MRNQILFESKTPSETYKDGQCIFMGNQYIVNKNCFIPKRSSEVLVEVAYDIVKQNFRNSFSILLTVAQDLVACFFLFAKVHAHGNREANLP